MTRASRFLTLAFCVLARALPGAQQPARDSPAQPVTGTASIGGVVVTAERTPQPARKTRVTLNSVDRSVPGRTATTDDAGRFVFRDLPAGRFTLAANKPAYLTANYGAKRAERAGTPITLANGQQIANLVMSLARGGVLTGVVLDQRGQPVPGAGVSALRYSYSQLTGEKTLGTPTIGSTTVTDDRGIYRAWGLPPGDYVLMVTPSAGRSFGSLAGLEDIRRITPPEMQRALQLATTGRRGGAVTPDSAGSPPLSQPTPGSTANYAPVFFPGTSDLFAATTLTLAAAQERTGIDVPIQLIPTARVTGTIALPEGVSLPSLSITLTLAGSQGQMLGSTGRPSTNTARLEPDKTFSFGGVTPGQYILLAKTASPFGRGGPAGPSAVPPAPVWWGTTEITMEGRDVRVSLELQPGLTVTGHVALEGSSPPPNFPAMRFFLVPPGSGGNLSAGPPGGAVDASGQFAFTGVTAGTYRLMRLGSIDRSWSLKSAIADGRDVLDTPLEIKANGVKDLVVTFTDQPTQLTGILKDTTGRAASDYFIVVFPDDKSAWTPGTRRVVETRPSSDGAYTVAGLPPGDYRVAALTDLEPGEWNDPGFLSGLVDASIRVTLLDGKKTTLDLTLAGGRN